MYLHAPYSKEPDKRHGLPPTTSRGVCLLGLLILALIYMYAPFAAYVNADRYVQCWPMSKPGPHRTGPSHGPPKMALIDWLFVDVGLDRVLGLCTCLTNVCYELLGRIFALRGCVPKLRCTADYQVGQVPPAAAVHTCLYVRILETGLVPSEY